MWSLAQPETGASYLVAAIVLPLIGWCAHGMVLGHVRGNAVRVSDKQFPHDRNLDRRLTFGSIC